MPTYMESYELTPHGNYARIPTMTPTPKVVMEESQEPATTLGAYRDALYELLEASEPERVMVLYEAVCNGEIDGGTYEGTSCCVIGHLRPFQNGSQYGPQPGWWDASIEDFVIDIKPGMTPETCGRLARLQGWIEAWMREQTRKAVNAEVTV